MLALDFQIDVYFKQDSEFGYVLVFDFEIDLEFQQGSEFKTALVLDFLLDVEFKLEIKLDHVNSFLHLLCI